MDAQIQPHRIAGGLDTERPPDALAHGPRSVAELYTKVLLPQRQKILHDTLLHYNAMQKSSYELLAAKERELVAERGYVEALRNYWIARAERRGSTPGRCVGVP